MQALNQTVSITCASATYTSICCESFWCVQMQIFVKTLADETILVNADPSDTIYDDKTRIHGELCDPPSRQCLMSDGKEPEEGRTIADYNIEEESTVQLALRPKPPRGVMQIFLKAPNGRLSLEVESPDTVEDVKKRIDQEEEDRERKKNRGREVHEVCDGPRSHGSRGTGRSFGQRTVHKHFLENKGYTR